MGSDLDGERRAGVGRAFFWARFVVVAGAYYGAAKLGLHLAYANSSVTAVWAPTGIALAALVLGGFRFVPAIALGALLANGWTGVPLGTVLGITIGNTLEAVVGALLLRRAGFDRRLTRVRDILLLAGLAAVLSTMVSATVGVLSLRLGDTVAAGDVVSTWRTWWLGDMTGDLLAASAILTVAAAGREILAWPGRRVGEAILILLAVAGVGVVAFAFDQPLAFVVFPALMWVTLRFGQVGAATSSLIVAGIAVAFTVNGSGQFADSSRDVSLLLSQAFMAVAAMTALLLAAVVSEREAAVAGALQLRRREALALHDDVVQGLAVAKYALDGGSDKLARRAVDDSLERSRALVTDLLSGPGEGQELEPGGLRVDDEP